MRVKKLLLVLIAINVIYALFGVLAHPLKSIDAHGIWLLKAKAVYLSKGFPLDTLQSPRYTYSHQQYPLLLPLTFSLVYSLFGKIQEISVLMLYPLVYLAVLIIAYKVLRRSLSQNAALLLTYIYSMFSPLIAQGGRGHAGNADILLALISWLMLSLIYQTRITKKKALLLAIFVTVASQIKTEGIFLASVGFFLPTHKQPLLKRAIFFSIALSPAVAWFFVARNLQIGTDLQYGFPGLFNLFWRSITILVELFGEFFNIRNWYLFWPLFFLALKIQSPLTKSMKTLILPTAGLMIAGYAAVYLFSTIDAQVYLSSSIDRVLFQLSPWLFLLFAEKSFPLIESSSAKCFSRAKNMLGLMKSYLRRKYA